MCGIAGFFGVKNDHSFGIVKKLSESLYHRGPNDSGIWASEDGCAILSHRRLSINDLSPGGAQPMRSKSGRFVIVFNGEIYNFLELRKLLESENLCFIGNSDTEVLLEAIELWGPDKTLQVINGMFSAVVYDAKYRKIFIFRDRLGVKPIYYQWSDDGFYFSSELTPQFSKVSPAEISTKALTLFFKYNYIPAPYSIFLNIYKLMPGTLAELNLFDLEKKSFSSEVAYWNAAAVANELINSRDNNVSFEESVEQLEQALSKSVKQRMISDVPLGAFLSGGIDSSLVAAHMQVNSNSPIKTFTIGFEDAHFNEANYADVVARFLATDHTALIVSDSDAQSIIPQLGGMYGEPFADSSQIPTYLVSKLAKSKVTVALSGDGADELFGGYSTYQKLNKLDKILRIFPHKIWRLGTTTIATPALQRIIYRMYGEGRYVQINNLLRLLSAEDRYEDFLVDDHFFSYPERLVLGANFGDSKLAYPKCNGNFVEKLMLFESSVYLPDDILTKVDRASMAVSLEVRAPFADDYELFELAWKMPYRHKINNLGGKMVLKSALERYLPRKIFERPKMGFGIPLHKWLNGPLEYWVSSCTDPLRVIREGILDNEIVQSVVNQSRAGDSNYAYKLWAICIFQEWYSQYKN